MSALILSLALYLAQQITATFNERRVSEFAMRGVVRRLAEAVHVELTDKALEVRVLEEAGEHMLLQTVNLFNQERIARRLPGYVLAVLL